jgi:hypothetical protein
MQDPDLAAMADREHPTCKAGGLQLTRLDTEHQPLMVITLHVRTCMSGTSKIASAGRTNAHPNHT